MATLHAQPYSLDAAGFYFEDAKQYAEKYEANRDRYGNPVEEYEIQFIDGTDAEGALAGAMGLNQANLGTYLDLTWEKTDDELIALCLVLEVLGGSVEDAMDKVDDVVIHSQESGYVNEGRLLEAWAQERAEEAYGNDLTNMPYYSYIDWECVGKDAQLNGEVGITEIAGITLVYDPSSV